MLVVNEKENLMSTSSVSSISTPSTSTSSIDNEKLINSQNEKLVEDQSIFYEASLAQAECDDDLGEDSERAKKSYSNFDFVDGGGEEEDDSVIVDSIIDSNHYNLNNLKQIFLQTNSNNPIESISIGSKLNADEKLSQETKKYWATIDFYNNSKLAFSKRLKSVKSKRDKLDREMRNKNLKKENVTNVVKSPIDEKLEEMCTCVKCAIVIHEAHIRGCHNIHEILCTKCHTQIDLCKCCIRNENNKGIISVDVNLTETGKLESDLHSPKTNNCSDNIIVKNGFSQFEEKLFNIKNELVNLSETSLDVFDLLLQLSDTVLDLNNHISSSTNVNQLFLLNSHSNLNNENFFYDNENHQNISPNNHNHQTPPQSPNNHKNKIENFLQKKFYSTQAETQTNPNKQLNNSITNIINKINTRSTNQNHKNEQIKKINAPKSNCSLSPKNTKLIENIYDKTSVTQFFDSLLNSKSGDELSRASSGFYSATSLLTMVNQNDDDTQASLMSDTSQSYSVKQTPNIKLSNTTNNIISRQIKNSSNFDLSDVKNFRHSTASTSSSTTDSSIDQNKFLTIQSPKSKINGNVAGLAMNFNSKNLGSNNTISSSSSCTSPVPNMANNSGARRPSFKFENNTILNRVQNMHLKNKFSTPQNLNDISETVNGECGNALKRCSLNRESVLYERYAVKRQQSCISQKLIQTPVRSDCCQTSSLDSGINLPSENEDLKKMETT
ncbi:unnamed protein product [Brachionus calyciflorus]|uniref:Uncharacterized protein n=1 Tax=Brachionus calyciflorus TaxID=104777 RepID=A0A813Z4B5_9BILA|nr:unnamed protein product [Brachionus calyciflorus]